MLNVVVALLCAVVFVDHAAWAQTVTTSRVLVSMGKAGESVITVNSLPKGISSYAFSISLADGGLADVERVILPAAFNKVAEVRVAEDGNSVTIVASDADDLVRAGDQGVELARVVFRATANGTTDIQFALQQIVDDAGGQLNPAVKTGQLQVNGGPSQPTVVGGQDSLQIGETVDTPIVLSETPPGGLKNYRITVTLLSQNKNIVTIEGVKFVAFDGKAKFDVAADGSSVSFSATDLDDAVRTGEVGIILARVVFTGRLPGTVMFRVEANSVESDSGSITAIPGVDGSLSVGGEIDAAPTFSNETPRKIAKIQLDQPLISIGVDDDLEALDPSSLRFVITDSVQTLTFSRASTGALWDGRTFSLNLKTAGVALAAGKVEVTISALDQSGNEGQFSWTFTVVQGEGTPVAGQSVAQAIAGDDGTIDDVEIKSAIQLWILGQAVPGTNGQTIDDVTIRNLIQLWITGVSV